MSSSLTIGSSSLRVLQNDSDHKLTRRSIEAVYTVMEDTKENRLLLEKLAIPFLYSEETLIIPGENAGSLTRFSNRPLFSLFSKGELVLNDPVHRQLLSTLIQSVLPKARTSGEYCSFITPGTDPLSSLNRLVAQLISLQGFTPLATTITLAASLAAFRASAHFSGYVIYLGHSHSEIGLVHQSRVVIRNSVPYGSEWMDEQLANARKLVTKNPEGQLVPNLAEAKAERLNPENNISPYLTSHCMLTGWYESLLDSLLGSFAPQMESMQDYIATLDTPPVVFLGELSLTEGFEDLLTQSLSQRNIRFDKHQVSLIQEEMFSIDRGALFVAAMEEETVRRAA
ncbi:hypothetical protein [uncultured Gimesia sp.]|uniref:hypothetical protein n=1 Tax=uncultured Gimesia sp. TaxID=1678688 RepID=UPI002614ABC2|nr:hypothetical protein [uncultured Gimesia sp.]